MSAHSDLALEHIAQYLARVAASLESIDERLQRIEQVQLEMGVQAVKRAARWPEDVDDSMAALVKLAKGDGCP